MIIEMGTKTEPLKEGVDYYVDEYGRFVFTAAYHLKRGSCCGNGCKHCPYGNSPEDRARKKKDEED